MPGVPLPPIPGQQPKPGGVPGAMNLPGAPAGGASGPGASPMVSPGDGAGMQAHIEAGIRNTLKTLISFLGKAPPGSKLSKTLARAVTDLNAIVGSPEDMGGAPKPAAPVGNAPPAGAGGTPVGLPRGGGAAAPGAMGGAPMGASGM